MKKLSTLLAAVICLGMIGLGGSNVRAVQGDDKEQQEGVDVLTRGPMHEAYAAPQSLDPKPSPIVPKKRPEPIPEMPPDQKPEGANVVWISGYWAWDDETADFLWVSGFWRDVPPGQQWVPGTWAEVQGGWQWTSGFWASQQQTQVEYVPPPPPTLETGPSGPAPAADQFYTPGAWVYVQRQYRWRPGFWLTHRPNWTYVSARYVWTSAGCVYVNGYWDYEITRRGLLFCPVPLYCQRLGAPGWRLLPRFIVYPEVIVSSLFVRPDYNRYCFGDYYGKHFLEHGFVPWVDYRLHKNIREPLFRQYAWTQRTNVNWERDLRKLYDDRRTGLVLRPPHTLAQQQQLLRDIAMNKPIKVGDKSFTFKDAKAAERNLTVINSITKVNKETIVLKKVTVESHAQTLKTIEHHADVKQVRRTTEAKIMQSKPTESLHVGKLPTVPKHLTTTMPSTLPNVDIPKHMEKVVPKYDPPKAPKANPKPLKGSVDRSTDVRVARWDGPRMEATRVARQRM